MNDLLRQKLCELIVTYGRALCDDPPRCEGLLRDFCGTHKREIYVLVGALKERVAADLLGSQNQMPPQIQVARLSKRFEENLGLAEDAARWAVDSWALALGAITNVQEAASQKDKSAKRQFSTESKRTPDKKVQDAAARQRITATLQQRLTADTQLATVETKSKPSSIRVVDTRAIREWRDPAEQKAEFSQRIASGGSSSTDPPPATAAGKDFTIIWELLSLPFKFVGTMVLLIGSASIAALLIFSGLSVVEMKYDQLGGTAQVLLGLFFLALTLGVIGILGAAIEFVKDKIRK